MILADTSVWIRHLRHTDDILVGLLDDDEIACHPFVIGELACGGINNEVLSLLRPLTSVARLDDDEVLYFMDRHRLFRRGIGLVDMHLLGSCQLAGMPLWSLDKKLVSAAESLGLAFHAKE